MQLTSRVQAVWGVRGVIRGKAGGCFIISMKAISLSVILYLDYTTRRTWITTFFMSPFTLHLTFLVWFLPYSGVKRHLSLLDSSCKHVDLTLTIATLLRFSCGVKKGNSEILEPWIDQFTRASAEMCFYLYITVKNLYCQNWFSQMQHRWARPGWIICYRLRMLSSITKKHSGNMLWYAL